MKIPRPLAIPQIASHVKRTSYRLMQRNNSDIDVIFFGMVTSALHKLVKVIKIMRSQNCLHTIKLVNEAVRVAIEKLGLCLTRI